MNAIKEADKNLTDSQRDAFDHTPKRSNIQLEQYKEEDFNLNNYILTSLFDDFILVKYVDMSDTGEVMRNGIFLTPNHSKLSWRVGKVILTGPNCGQVRVGNLVLFPNDKGITVSNVNVKGEGIVKDCKFLNEERIFGIVNEA